MKLAAPTALLALLAAACTPGDPTAPTTTGSTTEPTTTGTTTTLDPTTDDPTTGTTADPPGLKRCQPTCSADSDCLLGGVDIGFVCVDGQCGLPPCLDDLACQYIFGGWTDPCAATRDCAPGEACLAIDDGGLCATVATPKFTCADLGLVAITRPAVEGRDVTVCGNLDATCTDQRCVSPCKTDADCPPELGAPHCQTATGQCICAADDDCLAALQPGFRVCLAGVCGCSSDVDCAGGANVDTCLAGACGCSSTAACTRPIFDNVTQVCAP